MKPEPLKGKIKSIAGDRYFFINDIELAVDFLKKQLVILRDLDIITEYDLDKIYEEIDEAFEDVVKK